MFIDLEIIIITLSRLLAWSLKHALLEHDSLQAYAYVLSIGTVSDFMAASSSSGSSR